MEIIKSSENFIYCYCCSLVALPVGHVSWWEGCKWSRPIQFERPAALPGVYLLFKEIELKLQWYLFYPIRVIYTKEEQDVENFPCGRKYRERRYDVCRFLYFSFSYLFSVWTTINRYLRVQATSSS